MICGHSQKLPHQTSGQNPLDGPPSRRLDDISYRQWLADPYDGASGNLLWANICVNLNGYKWTKLYGAENIDFLSNTYAISPYINELERGK